LPKINQHFPNFWLDLNWWKHKIEIVKILMISFRP
jgi:hypothetical protein